MHFDECGADMFSLSENIFMPDKSFVVVEPEIFHVFCLRGLHIVDMDNCLLPE
jgi:hypothetical protein